MRQFFNLNNKFKFDHIHRYNKLFKLSPHLEKSYKKFLKSAKPDSNTTLICAQLRIGGARKDHAADFEFNKASNVNVVWNFIKQTFLIYQNIKNYKIFITTDSEVVEQDGIQVLGKDRVVVNAGPIKHIDRDLAKGSSASQIERTILDFHSLQNCDYAIVTHLSAFGSMGCWNRKEPFKNLYIYNHPKIEKFVNKEF